MRGPEVANTSLRRNAAKIASRVFCSAHTPVMPLADRIADRLAQITGLIACQQLLRRFLAERQVAVAERAGVVVLLGRRRRRVVVARPDDAEAVGIHAGALRDLHAAR